MIRRRTIVVLLAVVAAGQRAKATTYDTLLYPLTAPGLTVQFPVGDFGQRVDGFQTVASGQGVSTSNQSHALLWSPAAVNVIDLNPSYASSSVAFGTNGTQQVGSATRYNAAKGVTTTDATLWNGSAGTAVDLSPTNYPSITASQAVGVGGNQQVGWGNAAGTGPVTEHAFLWTGTAASAVDLTVADLTTFYSTYAFATDGARQVGEFLVGYGSHALLWSGTATSAIDLNPTNLPTLTGSVALGISGNQQVGAGYIASTNGDPLGSTQYSALLWNSSAGSAVNLNPSNLTGITASVAEGTNGTQQVGFGYSGSGATQALLWSGTAASVVNLQSLLPAAGSWTSSSAGSIGSNGTAFGTATGTLNGTNASFAASWIPTSTNFVSVGSGELYQVAGSGQAGISVRTIYGLSIAANGSAGISTAANQSSRQLVVISGNGLYLPSTGASWTAQFDLANNDLDLPVGVLATVQEQLAQGYNNGAWNGSGGIVSTSAANDSTHLTAIGYMKNNQSGVALFTASHPFDGTTPGAGDVLLKYTYYGDANLDGKVDGSDYSRIDSGFLTQSTGWFNGDFNYDGLVNGSDFTLIDNAFNSQGAAITAQIDNVSVQTTSQVPEPGVVGVVMIGYLLRARRRRSRRC